MGKALGAIVRFLFALFIVGLVGYNTYQVGLLRAQVAELQVARRPGSPAVRGVSPTHGSGTVEQIAEAQSHVDHASALLKRKKFVEAAAEMQAASDAMARAGGNAQARSRGAIAEAQRSLTKLSDQTAALWKQAEMMNGGKNAPSPTSEKNDKHSEKSR